MKLIQKCLEEKEINWKIFKIKAHTGIEGNKYTDKLAKKGLKSKKCFKITSSWVKGIRIVLKWEKHIIDRPIRNMVFDVKWKGLLNILDILKEEENSTKVDWGSTWGQLNKLKSRNCKSISKIGRAH